MQLSQVHKKQVKPQIRKIRHVDGSESEEEETKLRGVAVSSEWVLNKSTV
jgi:hypothetical protein